MKYIIKNCPAAFQNIDNKYVCPSVCRQEGFPVYCENTTNCLLKRIVELCNDVLEQETDPINTLEMSFAQKILDLLEIEEVNE